MSDSPLTLFDLVPGKVIGKRFTIQRSFRQGGMSATFIVIDGDCEQERELQVFPSALFDRLDQASEFADHLSQWCQVSSSAVLSVHEVITRGDGTVLLLTDLPQGKSLREWVAENKNMELSDVVDLGCHLLSGLEEIHGAGQVHGDIKPHTIHFDGDPLKSVLVDGGITTGLWSAKHLGDKTALIGTPFYAPVEQFGGDSPDVQSDVYNLATVLYELCVGVVPWPGSSFLEVFQAKLESRPPSMRSRARDIEVPEALEQAIVGGLLADRRERYADAQTFREALESVDLTSGV